MILSELTIAKMSCRFYREKSLYFAKSQFYVFKNSRKINILGHQN